MKNYKSLLCSLVLLFLFINMYSQKKAQSALKPYNIDWTTGNQTDFDLSHLLKSLPEQPVLFKSKTDISIPPMVKGLGFGA
jgi:hypothetical protein